MKTAFVSLPTPDGDLNVLEYADVYEAIINDHGLLTLRRQHRQSYFAPGQWVIVDIEEQRDQTTEDTTSE